MTAPGMTWTSSGTTFRQIFPKPFFSTVVGINKLIDRFMTDRNGVALQLHSPGNLLRRPSIADVLDHGLTQMIKPDELASFRATFTCFLIGNRAVIARQVRDLIVDKSIAFQLAENG